MNAARFHANLFLALSILFLQACVTPPRPAPTSLVEWSKEDVLDSLQRNPNRFPSFRGWIKASLVYPFEGKRKAHSFDGALVYDQDTQALRLQGFGMLGRTYFDVAYQAEEATIYLPPSSLVYQGNLDDLQHSGDVEIFFIMRKTLAGIDASFDPSLVSFTGNLLEPVVAEAGGESCLLRLDPETLLITKRTIFQDGELLGEIEYARYKQQGTITLPTHIQVRIPRREITFAFTFDSLTPEESLPASLFQVIPPPSTTWYPLSYLHIDTLL